ncbi:MAG: hypoxanthine phosphoribosyltransferase [Candidatus Hydrogenedentes bacterium]|nr:hypoxanthine phosphoribosyltransferase [Candidatus Hydrogenedentota bacterium]
MRLSDRPLLTAAEIQARVAVLGKSISEEYRGKELTVVAVLKGGVVFVSDLIRQLQVPLTLEFIRARSYQGHLSQGIVELPVLPEQPLRGCHVLVVEDIVDTGRTTAAILDRLAAEQPASLALCCLLDKPARHIAPIRIQFVGFTIDDHFVVGYGLDYHERYRELPAIYVLQE